MYLSAGVFLWSNNSRTGKGRLRTPCGREAYGRSVASACSFPAALLIREGVLPETSVQLTALVCAGLAALLSECLCFGKRRGGYAYIPLSALAAALILLLVGACLPMNGWDIGCVLKTLCVMTAMMTGVYFIKMNKNNKKSRKSRAGYYK